MVRSHSLSHSLTQSSRLKHSNQKGSKYGFANRGLHMQLWKRGYRHLTGTSVSTDAHLRSTEGHTPAQSNARVSACTYSPTQCQTHSPGEMHAKKKLCELR